MCLWAEVAIDSKKQPETEREESRKAKAIPREVLPMWPKEKAFGQSAGWKGKLVTLSKETASCLIPTAFRESFCAHSLSIRGLHQRNT